MATEPEDTETPETETSSLGDEWQWISNDTAEVLRATVEIAFTADPRKNWSEKLKAPQPGAQNQRVVMDKTRSWNY